MLILRSILLSAIWTSVSLSAGPLQARVEVDSSVGILERRQLDENILGASAAKAKLLPRSGDQEPGLKRRELIKFEVPFPKWVETAFEKLSFRYGYSVGTCWCKKQQDYMKKRDDVPAELREILPNLWLRKCVDQYPQLSTEQNLSPGQGAELPEWVDGQAWQQAFGTATCMCTKEQEHLASGKAFDEEKDVGTAKDWLKQCLKERGYEEDGELFKDASGRLVATAKPLPESPGKDQGLGGVFASMKQAASEVLGRFNPSNRHGGTVRTPPASKPLLGGVRPR